ncbi:ribosome maturation factor RimM [Lactobacillus melliventris]|uniref:ribosome maturation factor RimM n=1 Tax=Lactobacillus melliventris TaxID=1218507 RepID=UPI00164FE1E4|nr:ribosome maturation factor RimM [Lactobacillus melliventris]MBC6350321.1 ribosome maturation factor RimM [Lactobacillus melliventris]
MQFYDVARILSTHGLKGEVKVALITDFPEERFASNQELALKDNPQTKLTVKCGRPFKQFWLVQFNEITDIDSAEKLLGKTLVVSKQNQHDLPDGAYYYRDILGCAIIDNQSGNDLGKITGIETPSANDVWEVTEQNGNEYLIPYIDEVVKKIDIAHKKIFVELLEGLRNED